MPRRAGFDSVQECLEQLEPEKKIQAVVADGNYHSLANLCALQKAGLKVVIPDANAAKRKEALLARAEGQALRKASRSQQSKWGRQLMRLRVQHIERSFARILDCGGMRKATLRGQVNLQKRYNFAAACYNLSQLLRKKFGCGTLKMALATGQRALLSVLADFAALIRVTSDNHSRFRRAFLFPAELLSPSSAPNTQNPGFSTVC
jgi:hypothetical protein